MPQFVEIEGDIARIVRRDIVRQVRLADLLPNIERRPPITLPILPTRTRVVHWDPSNIDNQMLHIITELEPSVRTITIQDDRGLQRGAHRIAVPYTVFHFSLNTTDPNSNVWSFTDYQCFFSPKPIGTLDDTVIPALLPNVFEDGRICFGNTGTAGNQPLAARIDEVMNNWYLSNFNNIGHVRGHYLPWNSRTFDKWVDETANNPRCWTTFPEWNPDSPEGQYQTHMSIKDILAQTRLTRTDEIRVAGAIPALNIAPTFGMSEQWLQALTPTQRTRLLRAMQNLAAENTPGFFDPAPEAA